jgi:hypothetical protein
MGRRVRWRVLVAAVAVLSAVTVWQNANADESPSNAAPAGVVIRVLSNRADLISGGQALVEVILPAEADPSSARIDVAGRDVTAQFAPGRMDGLLAGIPAENMLGIDPNANALVGLVSGLAVGSNVLRASLPDGSGTTLTIINHPSGGPVFSGPQVQPWSCNAGATNAQCDRAPTIAYFYMPAALSSAPDQGSGQSELPAVSQAVAPDPRFQPYDPANPPPPAVVATTTTDGGVTVPFIVRVETGTIDRGPYSISVLADPSQPWSPWEPQAGWNHKLLFSGASSCGISYNEGATPWSEFAIALRRGFAVAFNHLMNTGTDCNLAVEAEAMMMTKEHFIEQYGLVRYTMGMGSSGGAIIQHWIANAYPGLYDGAVGSLTFPDGWTNQWKSEDCISLLGYWNDPSRWAPGVTWTPADWSEVTEYDSPAACQSWAGFKNLFTPADETGQVPAADVYDAQANPNGVRGTLWDYSVAQLGRRPSSSWTASEQQIGHGFANRPLDNVGVQYGLNALADGLITPAQFADLNAKVGGHDIDYNPQPPRTEADLAGLAVVYRSGYLNQANNLDIPVIDMQGPDVSGTHDLYHAWSLRARLDRANGNHENQVIWESPGGYGGFDLTLEPQALALVDQWLSAIEADQSDRPFAQKVVANKPAAAVDKCTNLAGGGAPCVIPPSGSPRLGAGAPLVDDIAKCQLRPLNRAAYLPVQFSDAEWSQLQLAFPTGVCDYAKPGVKQQPTVAWLTYEDGPGGEALGPAPESVPFGCRRRGVDRKRSDLIFCQR